MLPRSPVPISRSSSRGSDGTSPGGASPGTSLGNKNEFLNVPETNQPISPSFLFVPGTNAHGGPYTRTCSVASSICDLTYEVDQLERAVVNDDGFGIKKLLEIHPGKFNLNPRHASQFRNSNLDLSSCDSRSGKFSMFSNETDVLIKKCRSPLVESFFENQDTLAFEFDVPPSFHNALHLAIQNSAVSVARVLLRYGVDPNAPGVVTSRPLTRTPSKDTKDVRFVIESQRSPIELKSCLLYTSPSPRD